jgi:uncharacterized DUF497 family protein
VNFEWDPAKAVSNLAKHGIDFEDAEEVLADPRKLNRPDPGRYDEPRFRVVGKAQGKVLFVSYTIRSATYRIISVRRASRRERRAYTIQAGD